jgi:hypothetical protein
MQSVSPLSFVLSAPKVTAPTGELHAETGADEEACSNPKPP